MLINNNIYFGEPGNFTIYCHVDKEDAKDIYQELLNTLPSTEKYVVMYPLMEAEIKGNRFYYVRFRNKYYAISHLDSSRQFLKITKTEIGLIKNIDVIDFADCKYPK